jgi:hypothetical protein
MAVDAVPVPSVLPPPDEIRRVAAEVISRRDYSLGEVNSEPSAFSKWLGGFLEDLFRPVASGFDALDAISPVLSWVVAILICAIVILLLIRICFVIKAAVARRKANSMQITYDDDNEISEGPEAWELRSRQAAVQGDYISALRYLFRAGLLRLEQAHKRKPRKGATNREYLRFYRNRPSSEPLTLFVQTIDLCWYGDRSCSRQDYMLGIKAHAHICQLAGEGDNADSA